jgi:uncharacterized protein YcfL
MLLKKFFNLLTLILFSLFLTACATTSNQMVVNGKLVYEKEPITPILINEISQILLLVKQNNLALLNNKYIHPSYGFYDITKFEKENTFEIKKSITTEFSNEIDIVDVKIEKATFNCSPLDDSSYGWDKEGVFLDAHIKPYITNIMEEVNLLEVDKFKKEDLERANFIEQTSYEITIPYNVIFYLTKIENNWYITLIDNVATDCSR